MRSARRRLANFGMVTAITGAAVLLAPLRGGAEEPWWSVYRSDHRQWTLSLTGGLALLDLSGTGTIDESQGDTDIDFAGTLDLESLETLWGEADLQLFRGQHVRFAYTPMRFDASESLDESIEVDGVTYDIGDAVDSHLRLDQWELSFRSEFWIGEYVNVAPVVQVTLVDALIRLENDTQDIAEEEKALIPLPYLGLRAEVFPIPRLGLYAEAKGFTIGSRASIWDAMGGLSLHLTRNLSLTGRYRMAGYDVFFADSEIDLDVGGPYLGTTIRF